MKKREFLKISALSGIDMGLFPDGIKQSMIMPAVCFVVPSLGFSHDALEALYR